MEFKDKIKARRLELGLTLDEVAKMVGVSNPTISRWESGAIVNQRRDKIELLAKALQISPGELMGWELPDLPDTVPEDEIDIKKFLPFMTENELLDLLQDLTSELAKRRDSK